MYSSDIILNTAHSFLSKCTSHPHSQVCPFYRSPIVSIISMLFFSQNAMIIINVFVHQLPCSCSMHIVSYLLFFFQTFKACKSNFAFTLLEGFFFSLFLPPPLIWGMGSSYMLVFLDFRLFQLGFINSDLLQGGSSLFQTPLLYLFASQIICCSVP